MTDTLLVGATIAFFAVALAYAQGCAALISRLAGKREDRGGMK